MLATVGNSSVVCLTQYGKRWRSISQNSEQRDGSPPLLCARSPRKPTDADRPRC